MQITVKEKKKKTYTYDVDATFNGNDVLNPSQQLRRVHPMTIGKRETSTRITSRKMNTMKKIRRRMITASACAIGALALIGPSGALAADCDNFSPNDMDPTIPTFKQWADANGVTNNTLGGFSTGSTNRHSTQQLVDYQNAVAQATLSNPRVKVITRNIGTTNLGRPFQYAVVGNPDNINNLDSGRNDGAFWRGVREGTISAEEGEAEADERPAIIWLTATPHGSEPAAGEALSRLLYEFAARRDCHNVDRLDEPRHVHHAGHQPGRT